MALFAVRQTVNRDVGFSPHEIVFGRYMRGPLDILFAGWAEDAYSEVDSTWVNSLQSRLLTLCECAHSIAEVSAERRLEAFNKNKSLRELSVGQQVLFKIPGLRGSLETSWEGPFVVKEKVSRVNYRITNLDGKARVVHINDCKVYTPRQAKVASVCLVAEEDHEMSKKKCVLMDEVCDDFDASALNVLLHKYSDLFNESPGLYSVGECKIEIQPGSEVVNLPPHRVPIHQKEAVNKEVKTLEEKGIIVQSSAEWSSPVVLVKKPYGSIQGVFFGV